MLVTNSEIERMKKLFLQFDTNQNGFISAEELEEGLANVVGEF